MNKYQEALKRLKQETAPNTYCADFDKEKCINTLQELVDLHEKIKKDVEFLNSQDIQIFILPDGKEILGYNITECPSRILLAEAMRKNIENILKCLSRSDEDEHN